MVDFGLRRSGDRNLLPAGTGVEVVLLEPGYMTELSAIFDIDHFKHVNRGGDMAAVGPLTRQTVLVEAT